MFSLAIKHYLPSSTERSDCCTRLKTQLSCDGTNQENVNEWDREIEKLIEMQRMWNEREDQRDRFQKLRMQRMWTEREEAEKEGKYIYTIENV